MAVIASETDLCNQALMRLGDKKITSAQFTTPDDDKSTLCKELYEDFVHHRLTEYAWRFTLKKVELVESTAPINEWQNAYDFPADLVAGPYAVFDSDSVGANPRKEFEIFGTQVFTDYETCVIDYQQTVAVGSWPGYFSNYVIAALTSILAFPITDQQNTAEHWERIAYGLPAEKRRGGLFGQARHLDSMYTTSQAIEDYSLIAVRQS